MRPIALAALLMAVSGCASDRPAPPAPEPSRALAGGSTLARAMPSSVVRSVEPWTDFPLSDGKTIRTDSFRLFLTTDDGLILRRLPRFAETSLAHYRSAIVPLPPPPVKLDTFVMASRNEWEVLTKLVMGSKAEPYLAIRRGGFAAEGRGLFWDIGVQATMALAAHEGWHQYTQRTFKEPLPVWLEEGIATYMEGFRWDDRDPDEPLFRPWANVERFDRLREAHAEGRLKPLSLIVNTTPQDLIGRTEEGTLDYYAQIWGAVHFLAESEAYRTEFQSLLLDAANGGMNARIASALSQRTARHARLTRRGPAHLIAYMDRDMVSLDAEYAEFVRRLVRSGSRGEIVAGRNPLGPR